MRKVVECIDRQFEANHELSLRMLSGFPETFLFDGSAIIGSAARPFGTLLIRSAAEVEIAFGGITSRLWDDPFEWTLPEHLGNIEKIRVYLDEVRSTRVRGIASIGADAELLKTIPAPVELRTIADICLTALRGSSAELGAAAEVFAAVARAGDHP